MHVLYIIFLILTILIGAPTLVFAVRLMSWNSRITKKTQGKIYSYPTVEGGSFFQDTFFVNYPNYEFFVDGKEYLSALKFAHVKLVDKKEDGRVVFDGSGKPKQKIYLYVEDRVADEGPIRKAFPSKSVADVYYDPEDPEHNYAIRRPHEHPAFRFFLLLTAVNIALTVLFRYLSQT